MPPIELGASRPIGAVDVRVTRQTSTPTEQSVQVDTTPATPTTPKAVALSTALDAGEAPIDTDRVATVRRAIESGNYPIVPAKIADAMIAAGILLRTGQ